MQVRPLALRLPLGCAARTERGRVGKIIAATTTRGWLQFPNGAKAPFLWEHLFPASWSEAFQAGLLEDPQVTIYQRTKDEPQI